MVEGRNFVSFAEFPDVPVITTRHVLEMLEPIRYVVHYEDDDSWSFLCGTAEEQDDYRVVHLGHLLDLDPSITLVSDLLPGWSAWREDGESNWERFEEESLPDDVQDG